MDSVVNEGQEVEVKVLSIDKDSQRMSLSIKQAVAAPTKPETKKSDEPEEEPLRDQAVKTRQGPLKGGMDRKSGGEQFGLKW